MRAYGRGVVSRAVKTEAQFTLYFPNLEPGWNVNRNSLGSKAALFTAAKDTFWGLFKPHRHCPPCDFSKSSFSNTLLIILAGSLWLMGLSIQRS